MPLEGSLGREAAPGASDFTRLDDFGFPPNKAQTTAPTPTLFFSKDAYQGYNKPDCREHEIFPEWDTFKGAIMISLEASANDNTLYGVGAGLSASGLSHMELDIELEAATPLTLQLESKVGQKVHPLGSEVAFQARNFPPPSPALVYRQPSLPDLQKDGQRYPGLLLQPESRPISHKQLAAEVKSIYVGLTMVEAKCIHVERTVSGAVESLFLDHWQTLITLHNTLLHEHHDFFLASRHPSASLALHRLASKYSTPARMWKHVIHSFLELLRHHIPEAPNHRLAFIYRVHQMIALLYEKAPTFEDTWVECLGDLGRYRMAIEDEDVGDRETWAGVARSWYPKVAYKNPSVGRLYHHLAILASPNALQQTYYYARSLTCVKSFPSARISILALLDPILGTPERAYSRAPPVDASFIQAHGALFEKPSPGRFTEALLHFQSRIYTHICRLALEWAGKRVDVCVSFLNALLHCSSLSALVTCLLRLPIASASAIPTHQEPTGGQDSVYLDDSIVDFLFSALIIIYLALAYWFDPKTRRASLALSVTSATFWVAMVSEGDETFSSSSRWNILKIWAATTVALTCQSIKSSIERTRCAVPAHPTLTTSCSESATHKFLFQLLEVSALIQVIGTAIQGFGKGSFLNALPPCLSISVLATSKIHQNTTQYPKAAISPEPGNPVPADSSPGPNHPRSSPIVATNSHLPDPSDFDDIDLESLVSSRLDNVNSRPEAT